QVYEDPADLAGSDVLPLDGGKDGNREQATGGALKVGHLIDGDGSVRAAFRPRGEVVLRLNQAPPHAAGGGSGGEHERDFHATKIRRMTGLRTCGRRVTIG